MANQHEQFVAHRAGRRCEYCHLPSEFSHFRFVCDHIIAKKHGGRDHPDNLAFSCPHCNSHKLDNIAGLVSPSDDPVRLFNPRRDNWTDHFFWDGSLLAAASDIARVTIQVLLINDLSRVRVRQSLMAEGVSFA
jgi:hypothetical protein